MSGVASQDDVPLSDLLIRSWCALSQRQVELMPLSDSHRRFELDFDGAWKWALQREVDLLATKAAAAGISADWIRGCTYTSQDALQWVNTFQPRSSRRAAKRIAKQYQKLINFDTKELRGCCRNQRYRGPADRVVNLAKDLATQHPELPTFYERDAQIRKDLALTREQMVELLDDGIKPGVASRADFAWVEKTLVAFNSLSPKTSEWEDLIRWLGFVVQHRQGFGQDGTDFAFDQTPLEPRDLLALHELFVRSFGPEPGSPQHQFGPPSQQRALAERLATTLFSPSELTRLDLARKLRVSELGNRSDFVGLSTPPLPSAGLPVGSLAQAPPFVDAPGTRLSNAELALHSQILRFSVAVEGALNDLREDSLTRTTTLNNMYTELFVFVMEYELAAVEVARASMLNDGNPLGESIVGRARVKEVWKRFEASVTDSALLTDLEMAEALVGAVVSVASQNVRVALGVAAERQASACDQLSALTHPARPDIAR